MPTLSRITVLHSVIKHGSLTIIEIGKKENFGDAT